MLAGEVATPASSLSGAAPRLLGRLEQDVCASARTGTVARRTRRRRLECIGKQLGRWSEVHSCPPLRRTFDARHERAAPGKNNSAGDLRPAPSTHETSGRRHVAAIRSAETARAPAGATATTRAAGAGGHARLPRQQAFALRL